MTRRRLLGRASSLQQGMPIADVITLMGTPSSMHRYESGLYVNTEYWWYSFFIGAAVSVEFSTAGLANKIYVRS